MDSADKSEKPGSRMMPYLAILRHDLGTLWASRLVRLWLAATAILTLFLVAANWTQFQDATLIASILFPYLVFPWFFVVVVLGVTPVSGARAEALADGILSRPVSRCQYLLATWSARVAVVLGTYLIVVVPAIIIITSAKRPSVRPDTVTVYGIITTLFVVGLVLTFLVSLGFLVGTLLRKPLLAVVVLVFVWYPISLILSIFSLEQFSPVSLSRAVSTQLRQSWRQTEDEKQAVANAREMQKFSQQMSNFFSKISGAPAAESQSDPKFFESEKFQDFSLLSVTLGYALPTMAAVILAMLSFYWRDL
ncbi:MAG: ABC transporter permease [Planctomycetota bacterium]|jgi:ABC-type transport system involved in multi-copper enzyme maturation permease subunit